MPDTRQTLLDLAVPRTRYCVHCGRAFEAPKREALVCSPRCSQARWRATSMLAGTHATVNGKWVRIAGSPRLRRSSCMGRDCPCTDIEPRVLNAD